MTDPYRAHRIIFDVASVPKLEDAFNAVSGKIRAAGFELSPNVYRRLLDGLFDCQQIILVFGVDADLKLFEENKTLYNKNMKAADLQKLEKVLQDWTRTKQFRPAKQAKSLRKHKDAYAFYCDKILGATKTEAERRQLVTNFLLRNPNVAKLMWIAVENFIKNFTLCIDRVLEDKAAIEKCFLDGKSIKELADILVTGSDSHKGGKSVLILEFALARGQRRRVVYKPSDVEIDYRILGANTPAVKDWLQSHAKGSGYPQFAPSLYELVGGLFEKLIDKAIAERLAGRNGSARTEARKARIQRQLRLPTYVILPRNSGSKLKTTDGDDGIRSSYGYVQYLTHEPPTEEVLLQHKRPPQNSDWTVEEITDLQVAFRLWGRISTLAWLFLQTDLHHQNRILSNKRPHFIDLENMLVKPIETMGSTMVFMNWLETHTVGQIFEPVVEQAQTNVPLRLGVPHGVTEYNKDLIYQIDPLARRNYGWTATRKGYWHAPCSEQISCGIFETLELVSKNLKDVRAWTRQTQLEKAVVRNVVQPTRALQEGLTSFIAKCSSEREQTKEKLLERLVANRLKNEIELWSVTDVYRRAYALEINDYNGRDFLELDVPSYYRRIGDRNLLTSRGERVVYSKQVDAASTFLEEENQGAKRRALRFETFLPDTGIDLLNKSYDNKVGSKVYLSELVEKQLVSINIRVVPAV